jgi:putative DNA primase/helicase
LASRFVVLTLLKSFYGKEDTQLTGKLLTELPGILNWALKGLDRLRDRGQFEMPKSSLDVIRQLEDLASPVSAFLRDWCAPAKPDQQVNVKMLFNAYRQWCEMYGIRAGSAIVFGRNLRAVRPEIRTGGRGKDRFYSGVDLSQAGREQYHAAAESTSRRRLYD